MIGSSDPEPGAALRRCTGLDLVSFAEGFWAQQPLLSHHPAGFADLLAPADIDELVTERGLRSPFFRVVKGGGTLGGNTRSVAAGTTRISDVVDPDAIRESYAGGATLVLQTLHRIHPPLVRFCRELAAELGHPTQCNAYLTPPGSQGFAPHHDTHDVFVLQVDGHKLWHVHEPVITLPLASQTSADLKAKGSLVPADAAPLMSVVLGPGDALYLPRGYIHSAETNDDRSLHLTVGVLASTAYDVLKDVLTLAADEPEFRRPLPLGSPADQLAVAAGIVARATQWLATLPPKEIEAAVRSRITRGAGPEPLGLLATEDALRTLDKNAVVRPRRGLDPLLTLDPAADRVLLSVADRELSLPGYVEPALRTLLSAEVAVSELDLPVDDAIVLVRRLIQEGILTVA